MLPVDYFMVTFTLPAQLRALAWRHQTVVYGLILTVAISTLRDFGINPDKLGVELGMTAVLHTHARDKGFHPHVHIIVPGGGINRLRRCWKKVKGRYLFSQSALAAVFRARMLDGLNNGLAAVGNGETISIVPVDEVRQYALSAGDNASAEDWITRIIVLDHVSVATLIPILRPLMPAAGHLAAYPDANAVVIADRHANAERLERLMRELDAAAAARTADD